MFDISIDFCRKKLYNHTHQSEISCINIQFMPKIHIVMLKHVTEKQEKMF